MVPGFALLVERVLQRWLCWLAVETTGSGVDVGAVMTFACKRLLKMASFRRV